jgi:hypothetical protein
MEDLKTCVRTHLERSGHVDVPELKAVIKDYITSKNGAEGIPYLAIPDLALLQRRVSADPSPVAK